MLSMCPRAVKYICEDCQAVKLGVFLSLGNRSFASVGSPFFRLCGASLRPGYGQSGSEAVRRAVESNTIQYARCEPGFFVEDNRAGGSYVPKSVLWRLFGFSLNSLNCLFDRTRPASHFGRGVSR
jgi:hypothetical protein